MFHMDEVTGSAIAAERDRQHLTRTQLAKLAGVSLRALQTYEATEHPSPVQAANMRQVLEVLRRNGAPSHLDAVSNVDLLLELARRLAALMDERPSPGVDLGAIEPPDGVTFGRPPVE